MVVRPERAGSTRRVDHLGQRAVRPILPNWCCCCRHRVEKSLIRFVVLVVGSHFLR
jgi:hypothetical protein